MTVKIPATGTSHVAPHQRPRPDARAAQPWAPEWPRLTKREVRQIVLDSLG